MKLPTPRLALPFGILLALGCGARSTLDLLEDQGTGGDPGSGNGGIGPSGGSGGGGQTGYGGSKGSGGVVAGGGTTSSGGRPGTGGTTSSGGRSSTGGTTSAGGRGGVGGQGGGGRGGSPMLGGRAGGAGGQSAIGGMVTGGAGGSGAIGGMVMGGAGGSGAIGGKVAGGAGGSAGGMMAGGTIGSGGVRPTGGSIGSGGTTGKGGSSGAGGSTCLLPPSPAEDLIDDLNDGDRFIPPVNGRSGAWSVVVDPSPNAKIFPDPETGFVPSSTGDACRKYAAFVTGVGYVLWGSYFTFGLGSPYNASKYTGITFWARVESGTSSVIRVSLPDKDTAADGGLCQTNPSSGPDACNDHYGQRITLTTTWAKYRVDFTDVAQDGWGRQAASFDPATLYSVVFQIPVNATFAVWVDDVAFTM